MAVEFRLVETELGYCSFALTEKGLCELDTPQRTPATARRRMLAKQPEAEENEELSPSFAAQLQAYFAGEQIRFDVPLDLRVGTEFQQRVWKACEAVGYGETASYGDLAEAIGQPRAARAVGMAMKRNHIPIVIPCHRICRNDGSIGGYSGTGGLNLKQHLLDMEALSNEPI